MSRIVITGASGFIGVNLSSYLTKRQEVCDGVSLRKGVPSDLLNQAKVIVHLAGIAHELKGKSEKKVYFDINTVLTKEVFDLFLNSNCEIFILLSSVKAAADSLDKVLDESMKPNPKSVYGQSKLAAEEYLLSKKIGENKKVYILRPCMVHGPQSKGNLNLLYNFIKKGLPYPLGSFDNKRSFISIDNLCFVIYQLIKRDRDIKSGIYNVADNISISTKELVQIIGSESNIPVKILNINKKIIKVIAKIGDFIPLPINSNRLNKLTENYEVSNNKIKKAIAKEFPVNTIEGFRKTIKSFV